MLNNKQARMSAMAPNCPFKGPLISASDVGFNESARRSAAFTYGGVSLVAETNPFADLQEIVTVDHSVVWGWELGVATNQSDSGNFNDNYLFNGIDNNPSVSEIYDINKELAASGVDNYNFQELTCNKFGITYVKSFSAIKSLELYNMGSGNLYISLTGANSMADKFGYATQIKIPASGYYKKFELNAFLVEDDSNSIIIKNDSPTQYQLLILGDKA